MKESANPREWHRDWVEARVAEAEDELRRQGLTPASARHESHDVVYVVQGGARIPVFRVRTKERMNPRQLESRAQWVALRTREPSKVLVSDLEPEG